MRKRKAAAACHVSQPSLSAQLSHLERAVGARLFERDRRGVLVTAPGRKLLERARRVLADADDPLAEPPRGTIALVWRRRSPLCSVLKQVGATIRSAYPGQARKGSPGAAGWYRGGAAPDTAKEARRPGRT